jgi:hypothetical protein
LFTGLTFAKRFGAFGAFVEVQLIQFLAGGVVHKRKP